MSRETMQQSLDALNLIFASTPPYRENGECTLTDKASKLCSETIESLEAELAKPEQEPFKPDWVSYRQGVEDGAAPQSKKFIGLTQSEIEEIYMRNTKEGGVCNGLSIALEVQHMLKEKNL